MDIQTGEFTTFSQFFSKVEEIRGDSNTTLWYRGQKDYSFQLIPALCRKNFKNQSERIEEERLIQSFFRHKGLPYLKDPQDDFLDLFIMQHYGFPTRLLDWTENPLIGIFFAIDGWDGKSDIALYIIKPDLLNEQMLSSRKADMRMVLDTQNTYVKQLSISNIESGHSIPLAIKAAHNSERIISQRGAFTIFGADGISMEAKYLNLDSKDLGSDPTTALYKFRIPAANVPHFRSTLHSFGITESSIYPGLDGLSKEIKRERGFQ